MKRVTLVTTFAPNIGGGGAILRSLIPHLQGISVEWLYTGKKMLPGNKSWQSTHLGDDCIRSGQAQAFADTVLLWNGRLTSLFRNIADQILRRDTDLYWIVGHSEAVLLAQEIARRTSTPIHLTMHDDTAYCLFQRSSRFRWMARTADRQLRKTMRLAQSRDVVCQGMQNYYRERFSADSVVVHRYVPELPALNTFEREIGTLTVGHIGAIYSVPEVRLFCQALVRYAAQTGVKAKFIIIAGNSRKSSVLFSEFTDLIVDVPNTEEAQAVQELARCDFVYAMYPFARHMDVFRRTSSPTKLTTYLQAQRPIFAHTPLGSSLSTVVDGFDLGVVCPSLSVSDIAEAVQQTQQKEVTRERFEAARHSLHGYDNIVRLSRCLRGEVSEEQKNCEKSLSPALPG